jgi:hypothetical protein
MVLSFQKRYLLRTCRLLGVFFASVRPKRRLIFQRTTRRFMREIFKTQFAQNTRNSGVETHQTRRGAYT